MTELKYDAAGELTDAVYKDYIAVKNEDGKVEIYTEGQDGEFVFVAEFASPLLLAAGAATGVLIGAVVLISAGYLIYKTVKYAKNKSKWKPRKDKRKGSEKRQPSGARERNVRHKNGEEHSRVPKGAGRRPR